MHDYTLDVGIALYSNYAMQCNAFQYYNPICNGFKCNLVIISGIMDINK